MADTAIGQPAESKDDVRGASPEEDKARKEFKARVWKLYRSQVPVNTDMTAERNERVFPLPLALKPYLLELIEDPRDYIALEMLINMTLVVPPLMVLFWMYPSHLVGLAFLVFRLVTFAPRFFLTLHVTSHRRLFKKKFNLLNSFAETVLAFTLGMPPGMYYIHHVMMHHCENNVFPYDISSTMPHQRDSYWELAHYISKYFTHATFYLPYYAFCKKRWSLLAYHLVCWGSYFGGSAYLMQFYPVAVLWSTWIPFFLLGGVLMQGNYSQHVFVCPDDPFSNYKLTFNYVNHPDNQLTYNDGYHIVHHMVSRLHWSEMPQYFEDNVEKYAEADAFVFKEMDNQTLFKLIMKEDYDTIFKHWVQLNPDKMRTKEEFEALCRYRMQPIHKTNKKSL